MFYDYIMNIKDLLKTKKELQKHLKEYDRGKVALTSIEHNNLWEKYYKIRKEIEVCCQHKKMYFKRRLMD